MFKKPPTVANFSAVRATDRKSIIQYLIHDKPEYEDDVKDMVPIKDKERDFVAAKFNTSQDTPGTLFAIQAKSKQSSNSNIQPVLIRLDRSDVYIPTGNLYIYMLRINV